MREVSAKSGQIRAPTMRVLRATSNGAEIFGKVIGESRAPIMLVSRVTSTLVMVN